MASAAAVTVLARADEDEDDDMSFLDLRVVGLARELCSSVEALQREADALRCENEVLQGKLSNLHAPSTSENSCDNVVSSTEIHGLTPHFLDTQPAGPETRPPNSNGVRRGTLVEQGIADSFIGDLGSFGGAVSVIRDAPSRCCRDWDTLSLLDNVGSVVILLNVFLMGFQSESAPWAGWVYVDSCFALFYTAEVCIRMYFSGWLAYFVSSPRRLWNWFDAVLAGVGVVDLILDLSAGGRFQLLVRLARLSRISRLVRLIRLPMCADFDMKLRRFIIGMRSLKGSFILLLFTVWTLAVVLTQLVGADSSTDIDRYPGFEEDRQMLFSSVCRSCLTVFRCVNGDCTTEGGGPLVLWLHEAYDLFFLIPYYLCSTAITYGMLNMIAALFVESTLKAQLERRTFHDGRSSRRNSSRRQTHMTLEMRRLSSWRTLA